MDVDTTVREDPQVRVVAATRGEAVGLWRADVRREVVGALSSASPA